MLLGTESNSGIKSIRRIAMFNPRLALIGFPGTGAWILAFPDIGIQCFAFCKHSNSRILLFQTLYFSVLTYPNVAILDFGVFNIGIHCFGCSKHWTDCRFCWFFQTLEFYTLAFPNIAIQCFCWNLVLLLLQTLKFWNLPFPYNVIQCFISSKHWNFRFGQFFQT